MGVGWIYREDVKKERMFAEYIQALSVDQLNALRSWQYERKAADVSKSDDALHRVELIRAELARRNNDC